MTSVCLLGSSFQNVHAFQSSCQKDITHVKWSPQTCLSSRANVHAGIGACISLHRSPDTCMHAFNHHCSKCIHAMKVLEVRYGMHFITLCECQWSTLQLEGNAGLRGSVALLAAYAQVCPLYPQRHGQENGQDSQELSLA